MEKIFAKQSQKAIRSALRDPHRNWVMRPMYRYECRTTDSMSCIVYAKSDDLAIEYAEAITDEECTVTSKGLL